jgi:uncharacterized protein (DUF2147 family)
MTDEQRKSDLSARILRWLIAARRWLTGAFEPADKASHKRTAPMRIVSIGLIWLALAGLALADGGSPVGTWVADDGKSHVAIAACGPALCGTVTWLRNPLNAAGQPQNDANNPDPSLRARPVVGLQILQGLVPDSTANQWEGGSIYDPEDGKTYACTMMLTDPNTLRVHGYVGIAMFGRTQTWTRLP